MFASLPVQIMNLDISQLSQRKAHSFIQTPCAYLFTRESETLSSKDYAEEAFDISLLKDPPAYGDTRATQTALESKRLRVMSQDQTLTTS
jgi:hypothetical protein